MEKYIVNVYSYSPWSVDKNMDSFLMNFVTFIVIY